MMIETGQCTHSIDETAWRGPTRPCPGRFAFKEARASRGQATIEYVLLLGMAAIIGISFFTTFNATFAQGILGFNAILEQELMTGRFEEAAEQWEN